MIEFFKLTLIAIRTGRWHYGWYSKKSWPNKTLFGMYATYYDGVYWSLHLGRFCLFSAPPYADTIYNEDKS